MMEARHLIEEILQGVPVVLRAGTVVHQHRLGRRAWVHAGRFPAIDELRGLSRGQSYADPATPVPAVDSQNRATLSSATST